MSGGRRPEKTRATNDGTSWWKRIAWVAGVGVILGGAVFIAADVTAPVAPPPPELEETQAFAEMNPVHLAPGAPLPEYNSNPPTSGPHDPQPAPCGIYRQPVPDQAYLHSLEHGAVVIQYDPSVPQGVVEALEDAVRANRGEILLAPRPDNPAPFTLAAWTRLLVVDEIDANLVDSFEREFGNRFAPEPGAVCPFQVDQGT
ncbi:MAG: DUF3105 domain-containing protein [Acidimicrobiia bacterium]